MNSSKNSTIGQSWIIKHKILLSLLLLALILRVILLVRGYGLWWDSQIYIGMGKYLFSHGSSGTWEVFRPLGLPIILGTIWKMNLPLIIIAKIFDLIFSFFSVFLVYTITEKVYNKTTALYATGMFATIPLFLLYTGLILTEPLTILCSLLSIYLFILRKEMKNPFVVLSFSGIFASIAFLTKFPIGVILVAFIFAIILRKGYTWNHIKTKIKESSILIISFSLPNLCFFIFNFTKYNDPLIPLKTGSWIIGTFTWLYDTSTLFYFKEFFTSNFIFIFSIIGIILFFYNKEWKKESKSVIYFSAILLFFYFFQSVARKEVRYMTLILPFFCIMAANVLQKMFYHIKKKNTWGITQKSFIVLSILVILLSHLNSIDQLPYTPQDAVMQNVAQLYEENNWNGAIFSTHPFLLSLLDNKMHPTTASPDSALFEYERLKTIIETILLRDCDILCQETDTICNAQKHEFFAKVKNENTLVFSQKYDIDQCQLTVFTVK
jgi:hypothetical protein